MFGYCGFGNGFGGGVGYKFMSGWGGGIGMMIFWVAIIVLLIFLFTRNRTSFTHLSNEKGQSFEILKERYAKGEISDEEYEKKAKILRK